MHACMRTRRAYLVQGRSWCSEMKLVDGAAASAHDRLSLILETMTNAGKAGVALRLLLANALSGDGEDDDEGVMCWWNGRYSLCFSYSFSVCLWAASLSLLFLPLLLSLFRFTALSPLFCFPCSPYLYCARPFSFYLCWFLLYMLVLRTNVYNCG
ncbi:hypothetical protein NC653_015788 [Populus alba x Populus x berolinensis]|uniref:Uncharacterized protein n=1 Tax=Populus alba x Populus x berolinensis TaxID=444605 RepID=A0AAD6VYM8_9ROSI|nr:hypothetical protein NC653_015788 [Populus alba x Populus x berolinensis]